MEQIFMLFLKNGLRPLSLLPDTMGLEKVVTRSEIAVLLMLSFRGDIPMSELSTELGTPLSTMTSLTKRLVRKGFIERRKSPKDQRIILVQLSDKGQELASKVRGIMEGAIARVQAVLTPDEVDQFLKLAMKLGKALQQDPVVETTKEDAGSRKIQIDD